MGHYAILIIGDDVEADIDRCYDRRFDYIEKLEPQLLHPIDPSKAVITDPGFGEVLGPFDSMQKSNIDIEKTAASAHWPPHAIIRDGDFLEAQSYGGVDWKDEFGRQWESIQDNELITAISVHI